MEPKTYLIDLYDPETLRLIDQRGVRQCVVPNPTTHTACWDTILAPDGQLYLSLCSELTTGEYTKLARYDPTSNTIQELHYLKERLFSSDRMIRPSKLHTSFSWLEDGRLIMLTHTTDKAPQHPAWMPQAYYANPWEGFPGSSMLIYDPKTDHLENLGIPVPRETLYGGVYDSVKGYYYAIGFLKGELYQIDPRTRRVKNFGQVTERASYRMVVGSDDNIYFTTRNGVIQRINVREERVENLGIQLPHEKEPGRLPPYFSFACNGPDGRLYMAGMHDRRLSSYDPETGRFTVLGSYWEEEGYVRTEPSHCYMGCMTFDKEGVLYYIVVGLRKKDDAEYMLPCVLMRWDLLRGGKPERLGLVGTPQRVVTTTCSMIMDRERDMLYVFGTNHADDGPDVTAIDMVQLRRHAREPGPLPEDVLIRPGNGAYERHAAATLEGRRVLSENPTYFMPAAAVPVPLWQTFSDREQEDSHVIKVRFAGDRVEAICGKDRFWRFLISPEGEILSKTPTECPKLPAPPDLCGDRMPSYPGRQYRRTVTHCVNLPGGRMLAATEDGLLAIVDGQKTFALGPAWINGPVQAMTAGPDGTVYGVAGDPEDIGIVFSYSDEGGLHWLGSVYANTLERGVHSSPWPTAIAVDDTGSRIAIGAGGRMGHVYLYRKGEC